MSDKRSKTIAEYAIRKWLGDEGFQMEWFDLDIRGNEATLTDRAGDTLKLRYDKDLKKVIVL